MPQGQNEHSTVWIPLTPDHPLIARTTAVGLVHLPVFLTRDALGEFKQSGVVRYSPSAIFLGLLLGLQQDPPTIDLEALRPVFIELIDLLANDAGVDAEDLALSATAFLRDEYGSATSRIALRTAREQFSESPKIASDYIMDVWAIQEERNDWDHTLLVEIASIGATIDLGKIDPEISPAVTYVTALALSLVDPRRAADYWEDVGRLSLTGRFAEIGGQATGGVPVSLDEARFLASTEQH